MLPPPFAAFAFLHDTAGRDDALARRLVAAAGGGPALVLGAGRPDLLTHAARGGIDVIGVDASRATLARARGALTAAGVADRVTLFAADARDVEVPGGCRVALVPALVWRVLPTAMERQAMLRCLSRAVEPGGSVCLDLDRIPDHPPRGAGWSRGAVPGRISVRAVEPGAHAELELADVSPEAALAELREAGLAVTSAVDAATGTPWSAQGTRLFAVSRPGAPR